MILNKLSRLFDMAIQNRTRICGGFSIQDHLLFVNSNKIKENFTIRNYHFPKALRIIHRSKAHTNKFTQKCFEKSSLSMRNLANSKEIWNTTIKESELLTCRGSRGIRELSPEKKLLKVHEIIHYTEGTIIKKFNAYINSLEKLNESEVLSFLQISKMDYKSFEMIIRHKDKIFEMAVLLKCSPNEGFKAILKHHFLLNSKITTLQKKVALVTGSGIDIADLRRDLWVLSYAIDKLQSRIEKVKTLNLPIKCWMLHCKETTLNRTWENREKNKAAMLPFTNSKEYLLNRLEMNDNQLLSFTSRYPAVLKIKTAKLRGVLDYLLSEGFTTSQIYSTPRILCHSISTIKTRLGKLRDRDCEPRTLSLLCMSAKAFETYLQKFEKTNQSSEKT